GDNITRPRRHPADRIWTSSDENSVAPVAESRRSGDVGANEIALHQVFLPADEYAALTVAGDDIAVRGARAPDHIGVAGHAHADEGVAAGDRPGRIRADVVAEDDYGRGPNSTGFDAVLMVAADQVAVGRRRAADRDDVGAAGDPHTVEGIPEGRSARRVQSDPIPANTDASCKDPVD